MSDIQRAKLFAAEEAIWPLDSPISDEEVHELIAELNSVHRREIAIHLADGDGHVKSYGGELWLPRWARRPLVILHEYAHALVSPIFPCHGAEFAARLLALVRAHIGPGIEERLRVEFDARHVHYDVEKRRVRARRCIVNAANTNPGAVMEVIADDPPELIVGPVGERCGDTVRVGEELVEFTRLRYVSYLSWDSFR